MTQSGVNVRQEALTEKSAHKNVCEWVNEACRVQKHFVRSSPFTIYMHLSRKAKMFFTAVS